ncbi:hypothetical protein LV457_15805 [Mycobacterium sp. MYCO198283]|uniref:serine hydrolase n=1 Tax=Mycobacterium sp. MYCO198283 TaxID=2883505 RepID=UPI001E5EFDBA|nr:serine hydrolase [Mycobacterium sp. MYCO198283]MCG5433740.1 hypothetical protein [Mycobacterium sp. MYCO198283]
MRIVPSALVTPLAATVCALLVAGCVGQSHGEPGAADDADQRPAVPMSAPAVPATPPEPAVNGFDGLAARTQQATADATAAGASLSIAVMDRTSGQTVSNGNNRQYPIASVVKLFIADDLLLQASRGETTLSPADRQALDVMLRSSDDSAAQTFWDRSGGNAVISRVAARYGLSETRAPYNGHWDLTLSTTGDLVRYYDMLLDGSGGLPAEQVNVIVGNLAQSTPTGLDGYPQRFGIPEGLYAEPVAVKQGWFCCWNGSNQLHMSTGIIGADRRYVMAMGSLQPVDEDAARAQLTQAVKTMFPAGRI